jgi:hypothetical protein
MTDDNGDEGGVFIHRGQREGDIHQDVTRVKVHIPPSGRFKTGHSAAARDDMKIVNLGEGPEGDRGRGIRFLHVAGTNYVASTDNDET